MLNRRALVVLLFTFSVIFGLAVNAAHPRDLDNRYANSPNKAWIESLKNKDGMGCCDSSDGFRVEDPNWRSVGADYEVQIDGTWHRLSDSQIITETNRIGYAMVWIFRGRITCFMPGARG